MSVGLRARRLLGCSWLGLALLSCTGRPLQDPLYATRPQIAGQDTSALAGRRILIDPGHGGRFAGARGPHATREADVNLGVGLYLWGLLRDAGADVHLTRSSDRDLVPGDSLVLRDDLEARVALLDSLRPEVFLSLHHNSNLELDRERNTIETYFKLGDDGPSYDLARAIHTRLVQHLGIQEARILPGNYFVLRHAGTAAVLGEASYLSNPEVESKLRLAEKQMLEAEAYFLGLLEYFERGVPTIQKIQPSGDSLRAGDEMRFRLRPSGGPALDPLAVESWIDGRRVATHLDAGRGELVLQAGPEIAPGTHQVVVKARNARGNAARPWQGRLVVHALPARVFVNQEPEGAGPGSEVRLRIRILDTTGRTVGDGLPVRLEGHDLDILDTEPDIRDGELLALVRLRPGSPVLRIQAGSLGIETSLAVRPEGPPIRFVRCRNKNTQLAVQDAWGLCDTNRVRSDRAGYLEIRGACDTLRIERQGYRPWQGARPQTSVVDLEPLHDGMLHDITFVLDPAGSGREALTAGPGVLRPQRNHDLSRLLGDMLRASGARVVLARGVAEDVTELERVQLAVRHRAEWYVQIDVTGPPDSAGVVLHYPGSTQGARLASSIAAWLDRRSGQATRVAPASRFVLQQTPCPAVSILIPPSQTAPGATDARVRETAYALFLGIRTLLAPQTAGRPPLVGRIEPPAETRGALAVLDASEVLPLDAKGVFGFECVAPGPHRVALHHSSGVVWEWSVVVAGEDTTRVELRLAIPQP